MNATRLDDLPQAELRFIEPMYASPAAELPKGDEWLYEIKLDGYRCLAGRDSRGVTLWSRRANLFTSQFPTIARAFERLAPDTLVDGEVVAIDETGRISFNLLQHHRSKAKAIQFYAFDLLIHSGRSLLSVPLVDRRRLLVQALSTVSDPIRFSESFDTAPTELIAAAKQHAFEGIIAKRKDSWYQPGKRSRAWLKYKINCSQEFVINGYTPRNPLDALIVSYY